MRYFTVLFALLLPCTVFAASMDADGDGTSDPTIVEAENQLDWKARVDGSTTTLAEDFGRLGNHLMPGHYSGNATTELAVVNDSERWSIRIDNDTAEVVDFGEDGSSFLGGADFDGDGKDDISYRTNACRRKGGTVHIMTNVLAAQDTVSFRGGQGTFYNTFGDVDGDGKDEYCFLKPLRKNKRLTGHFRMICRDGLSGNKVKSFKARKVFSQPLPIKRLSGESDLFAFIKTRSNRNKTIIVVRDVDGRRVRKVVFNATGTVLVGNFTNTDTAGEQLGLYVEDDDEIIVQDLSSDAQTRIDSVDGIPVDEINLGDFEDDDNCYCTSKTIKRNGGRCSSSSGDGGTGGNCFVMHSISDGGNGFLHKPRAENNPNIVNLFPPELFPAQSTGIIPSCWYENSDNEVIGSTISTGFSNPNRPTYRPNGPLYQCSDFPRNFIIACELGGQKSCWQIPEPCTRYD